MNFEQTIKALQTPARGLLDKDMSKNDKQEIMNSDQPIQIIYGTGLGDFEIKNIDNPKDIAPIGVSGKKGVKYIAAYKGDWNFRLVELDESDNVARVYTW